MLISKKATFGQYLDLPEDNNARFPIKIKMVYDLLKRRFIMKTKTRWMRNCGPFVAAYTEYLSDGLQVSNDGLDVGLLRKRYAALVWKYGEAKAQKPYASDTKDPRRPKPNSVIPDEEQLVPIDYIFIA
ncbi:hypothetical protein BC332_25384 [Capsicum chinense]|nr:hypothetical protein BC332_25384 [Capsicum chinense]